MVSFGRNWPLAAPPGPGTARNQNLSTVGTSGLPRQPLATILSPFPTTLPNFGPCLLLDILTRLPFFFGFSVTRQTAMPIRTAPRFCLGGCGRFEKLLYGCRDPSHTKKVMLRQDRCLLLRQDRCLLLRRDRCLLLRHDRCLLLRQDRCKIVRQGSALPYQ